jgi:hypothetical protein
MAKKSPRRLSKSAIRASENRVARIAEQFGFVGRVSYQYVYSQSGGAQYGQSPQIESDLLIVYAEAFDQDADPGEFSLEAILAHERGHQVLVRHPRIARLVAGRMTAIIEEVLASVLGALLCSRDDDRDNLIAKAAVELADSGAERDTVARHGAASMMGPMKLSEIKAVLKRTFSKESDNPIQWLEGRIHAMQQSKDKEPPTTKTLESLLRVLKGATTKKRRKRQMANGKSKTVDSARRMNALRG